MEKIINIDGKDVRFVANAATPRIYRNVYKRDMLLDMQTLINDVQNSKEDETLSLKTLQIFENAAYIMAKQGDRLNVPSNPDEWFENFEIFSIYEILPEIAELWEKSTKTLRVPKKKAD